jgi:hypothetical protein
MFKGLFGRKRTTTKGDLIFALAGALYGLVKAHETYKEYQEDKENKK